MAAPPIGGLLSGLRSTLRLLAPSRVYPGPFQQSRDYAARKGTRERMLKRKQAFIKEKLARLGRLERQKKAKKPVAQVVTLAQIHIMPEEESKPAPVHRIWMSREHPWKVYSFEEAIHAHRQSHHPTMYNLPNSDVEAFIEIIQNAKKYTEGLPKIFHVPHKFTENKNANLVAFVKDPQSLPPSLIEGVLCGGRQLVKQFEEGTYKVKSYSNFLAESAILPDILVMKGLLKGHFPTQKQGTLGPDIIMLIEKFKYGVNCESQLYADRKHQYLLAKVKIGQLGMDVKHLEENFASILDQMQAHSFAKRTIHKIRLLSPPSPEKFKIDISPYVKQPVRRGKKDEEEADREEQEEADLNQAIIESV